MQDYAAIWKEVSSWPPEERLALANRLLDSVRQQPPPAISDERKEALLSLIGIWKMDNPPSDEELDRMRFEGLMEKYS